MIQFALAVLAILIFADVVESAALGRDLGPVEFAEAFYQPAVTALLPQKRCPRRRSAGETP